jgi:hypothetical protein
VEILRQRTPARRSRGNPECRLASWGDSEVAASGLTRFSGRIAQSLRVSPQGRHVNNSGGHPI